MNWRRVVAAAPGCGGGCGSQTAPAAPPTCRSRRRRCPPRWSPRRAPGRSRSWAVRPRSEDNFWQLFVRPAGTSRWSLVTPEGVADNGGLVAADGAGGASLLVGFRPSQGLAFSPLATSSDTGRNWTPGLLDADLADVPDAMAVAPSGRTLALLSDGSIEAAATSGAAAAGQWSRLTSLSALAATAPGRECGLVAVNAVTFGPDNVPMAAGSCARPGVAGVFADTGGAWQAAGPVLPAGFGGDQVQVLGLAATVLASAGPANRGQPTRGQPTRGQPTRGQLIRGQLRPEAATRRCCWPGPACWRPGRTGDAGPSRAQSRRRGGRERVGVRAGRERLGAARRGARGDDQRARIRLAHAAGAAGGHRDAGAGAGARYVRRAGGVGVAAHHLATGRDGLGQGAGHQRADLLRLIGLGQRENRAMSYITGHWSFDPFVVVVAFVVVLHERGGRPTSSEGRDPRRPATGELVRSFSMPAWGFCCWLSCPPSTIGPATTSSST